MARSRARRTEPKPSADLIELCGNFTWSDCWEMPVHADISSRAWAEAIFSGNSSPWIVVKLMNARNAVMARYEQGDDASDASIGSFPLAKASDRETILGKDRSHLTFFTSISVDERRTVRCTTIMRTNNAFGRLYWFFVRKAHPFIIRSAMDFAAAAIDA